MHRFTLTALSCAVAAGAILSGCAPATASTTSNLDVIAHQGGGGEQPPQSLQAVKAAGRLGTPVEFDLKRLKDGGWALAHDDDVSKILKGKKGKIQSMTRSQWRASCLKGPTGKCGTPITWAEAVKAVPKTATLVPEIKDTRITPAKMVSVLKKYKVQNRTVVQTFDPKVASYLGKHGVKTVLLSMYYNVGKRDWAAAKKAGVTYAGLDSRTSVADTKKVKTAGLKLWVWTINDKPTATTWAKRGAAGIFTDDPKAMKAKLK